MPVAAIEFGYLKLVDLAQEWIFTTLPSGVGFTDPPTWWPLPVLVMAGIAVGLTVQYLPGRGGHEPSGGLSAVPVRDAVGVDAGAVAFQRSDDRGEPLIAAGPGNVGCS